METIFQFYFSVGLTWAMFWSFKLTTIGFRNLRFASDLDRVFLAEKGREMCQEALSRGEREKRMRI